MQILTFSMKWSRVHISADKIRASQAMFQTLKARPASLPGIKSIHWNLLHGGDDQIFPKDGLFEKFCSWDSILLKLEHLNFDFIVDEANFENMSQALGRFAGLSACRDLQVKDSFGFTLSVYEYDDYEEMGETLIAKYEPFFRDIMMPDPSRPQITAPTMEEAYMRERLKPLPKQCPEFQREAAWLLLVGGRSHDHGSVTTEQIF